MRIFLLIALLGAPVWAVEPCVFCKSTTKTQRLDYVDGRHPVCYLCRQRLQKCTLCSQPAQSKVGRDGRLACRFCREFSVFEQAALESLYGEVKGFLARELGGLTIAPAPPVQLADKDELQTKFTRSGRSLDVGGFYQPYNPEMIYILSGLTPIETAATLVHEYTHAWQSRNCPLQDRALTEGFATWVQYHYLMSVGESPKAYRLTRHHDPDYGASLRALLAKEKKLGKAGVIKFARTSDKL